MLASTALIALLGLPVFLGVLQRVAGLIAEARPRVRRPALAVGIIGAIGVLGAAWAWRWANIGGDGDAVVGGWTALSFTGTPLTLGGAAGGTAAVIALSAAHVVQLLAPDEMMRTEAGASHGVLLVGAALALLGESTPTLLIGLGLMVIAGFWHAVRHSVYTEAGAAILTFGAQLIAVLIAGMVFIVGGNAQADFRLDAAAPLEHSLLTFMLNVAVALQANLLPFGALRGSTSNTQSISGVFGAAAILAHTSSVEPWLPALAAATCVFWSMRALGATNESIRYARLRDAAGAFAMSFGIYAPEAAAAGWLLGTSLLRLPGVARFAALPALLALPGSVGFAAAASAPPSADALGLGLTILRTGSAAVIGFALLRDALGTNDFAELRQSLRSSLRMRQLPSLAIAGTHALVLGLAPSLAGLPALGKVFSDTPAALWISLLVAAAVSVALWRIAGAADLTEIDAVASRAANLLGPFFAGLNRISTGVGALLPLLDSDGALLLTCLALVIAVLTTGQATP